MVERVLFGPGGSTEVKQDEILEALAGTLYVDAGLPIDIFSNLITGQRDNQIEVHFDDSNYADYLTHTTAGGGQGGSRAQSNGQVRYSTGTAATGRSRATTTDVVRYRPMHETYAAWTAAFLVAGAANSWQRIGFFTDVDGVFVGYEGASFGLVHRVNSVDTHIPRASWEDPCDGSVGSGYTRHGVPEDMDLTELNVYRLRLGWLGAAGFVVEVLSPDWTWVPIYTLKRPNQSDLPFFTNADLPQALDVGKTSGATNFIVATNCWAGGTTSDKARLSDPITDRTLALTTRSVITGKTTAGGGAYVDVKVNPSGALVTDASGSTVILDSTTLAALESVQAQVSGTVALDAPTLAALENIIVTGTVALDAPTLAALESITAVVSGTVDLGASTLAALESITATVSGNVSIDNLPAEYPLPAGQIATLTPQTDALTDAELRATPVPTRDAGVLASSHEVTGPVTEQTLIDPGTDSLVLRKFHLHADPALAAGTYPVVTLELGGEVIFRDKFEPGLPYAEGIPIFGGPGDVLTVSVSAAATIYLNIRHELI